MGVLYVVAGVMHFLVPHLYAQIIPPFLPFPLALVYVSGVAEFALGVGVLIPRARVRQLSAWGIIALLVAVFPANVYMAVADVTIQGAPGPIGDASPLARWLRLPLQFVLVAWA